MPYLSDERMGEVWCCDFCSTASFESRFDVDAHEIECRRRVEISELREALAAAGAEVREDGRRPA